MPPVALMFTVLPKVAIWPPPTSTTEMLPPATKLAGPNAVEPVRMSMLPDSEMLT